MFKGIRERTYTFSKIMSYWISLEQKAKINKQKKEVIVNTKLYLRSESDCTYVNYREVKYFKLNIFDSLTDTKNNNAINGNVSTLTNESGNIEQIKSNKFYGSLVNDNLEFRDKKKDSSINFKEDKLRLDILCLIEIGRINSNLENELDLCDWKEKKDSLALRASRFTHKNCASLAETCKEAKIVLFSILYRDDILLYANITRFCIINKGADNIFIESEVSIKRGILNQKITEEINTPTKFELIKSKNRSIENRHTEISAEYCTYNDISNSAQYNDKKSVFGLFRSLLQLSFGSCMCTSKRDKYRQY
jgi:hypothetical protein